MNEAATALNPPATDLIYAVTPLNPVATTLEFPATPVKLAATRLIKAHMDQEFVKPVMFHLTGR